METESPRGRVMISAQILAGELPVTADGGKHLENCLMCGTCDRVCPNGIPVTSLISQAKSFIPHKKGKVARFLAKHPKLLYLHKPQVPENKADNLLFCGCSGKTLDRNTLNSCIKIFNRLNIGLQIQPDFYCCGSVHSHTGFVEEGEKMFARLTRKLKRFDKIIYFSTGCASKLDLLTNSVEICSYLGAINRRFALKPLAKKVSVHIPCSQKNNPNAKLDIAKILQRIPEIKLDFIEENECCGAGLNLMNGNYNNTYVKPIAHKIHKDRPHIIVSANLICRMQLAMAIAKYRKNVRIIHPVTLIAEQLENASDIYN